MTPSSAHSAPIRTQPPPVMAGAPDRFPILFENVSDMAVIIAREEDGGYRCLAANEAVSRMEGIPLDIIVGKRVDAIHPPAAYAEWKAIYDRTLETGGPLDVDHEVPSPLGPRKRRTRFVVLPPDGTGRELLLGVCQDLTDTFMAASEREDFDRYRAAMQRLNAVLDDDRPEEVVLRECVEVVREVFGADRCFLAYPCNPDAETITLPFYSERPDLGLPAFPRSLPVATGAVRAFLAEFLQRQEPLELGAEVFPGLGTHVQEAHGIRSRLVMPIRPKTGEAWSINLHRCGPGGAWTASDKRLYQDMAVRIKSCLESLVLTRTLRKSEAFHNLLTEKLPQLLWTTDGKGNVHFANRRMVEFTGVEDISRLGREMPHIHPEDIARETPRSRQIVSSGRPYEGEMRIRRRDGAWVWHLVRAEPLLDADGRVELVVGTCTDISDAKLLQEDLLRSREQMAAILAGIADAIIAQEPGGRIVYANEAAAKLLGFATAAELIAAAERARETGAPSTMEFFDEQGQPLPIDRIPPRLARQGIASSPAVLRFRVSPQAKERWVLAQAKPLLDAEGKVSLVISMSQDVTELKEKDEVVRRLQKMESLGKLAGGIAHDFNNLLVTINGYSDMGAQMTESADPRLHEFFEEILKSGRRAAALTQQLLAYSRKQIVQPKPLDLNALVEDMRKLLARLIGEDIRMEMALGAGLPPVKADPSQLEQVLLNLSVNARDAMPKGGSLRIETGTFLAEGAYLEERPDARPGPHVYLRVADSGTGMDPAVLERIFDPFFTTKPVGKGTGLGLASVYGIVDQAGGHISVETRVGSGSTFTILLPAHDAAGAAPEAAPMRKSTPAEAKGTVLLVEDEESVLKFTRLALETKGYRVFTARDGKDALALAGDLPGLDLLISDVVMPGMRGPELVRAMRERIPGLKVLLMSGYIDPVGMEGEEVGRTEFIQKPFGPDAIVEKVGRLAGLRP